MSSGRLTVGGCRQRGDSIQTGERLTKQSQQVFSSVDCTRITSFTHRAHLISELSTLKAVEQVVAQRLVEIQSQPSNHFLGETAGKVYPVSLMSNTMSRMLTHPPREG